jgi:O-antigen/teichoic acid export membrane protein
LRNINSVWANGIIAGLDWSLLRGSAVITVGSVLSRGFGFVVTLLLARLFDPSSFGVVQYAISVAGIIAIGLQPLGQHVLPRYVGMFRDKPIQLREYMSNIWGTMGIVTLISLALAVPLLFYTGKLNFGILAIFLGTGLFYAYYGLARGFQAPVRLAAVDVGKNGLQVLLIILLLQFLDIKTTFLAMLIEGLAPILPIVLLQRFWALPNAFEKKLLNRNATKDILKFSVPIWVSHASYILFSATPILFLEHFTDDAMVGIFSLATTMGIALSFFPNGLATLLMPKIAGAPEKRYRTLLVSALGLVTLTNIFLIAIYYFFAPWLVGKLFGQEYLVFPQVFVLMAIVVTFNGAHAILTSAYVGRGRAYEETKSRLIALLATFVSCWLLIPSYGVIGAVCANLIGAVGGLMVYGYVSFRDQLNPHNKGQ